MMLALFLLMARLVAPSSTPAQQVRLPDADSLLRARRYVELERWLARPGAAEVPQAAFFAGIMDNRRNRNARAVERLAPLLRDPAITADTARRHALLETLADSYGKLYRYPDAAAMLDAIDREFASAMPPDERRNMEAARRVGRLLVGQPRQETTLQEPFAVAFRHNAIGLREAPVYVAHDTSWWLLDTGANYSTVTARMARRLGLTVSRDSASTAGISGVHVPLRVAVVPSLRLGSAEVRNVVVLVLPDSALYIPQVKFQIDAILGYPVIEALGVVTMADDSLLVGTRPGRGAEADMYLEQLNPLVAAAVDGRTELYHLDTGANTSVFTWHFRATYPARFAGLARDTTSLTGAGGGRTFPAYRLRELPIALGAHRVTLRDVIVLADSTPAPFDHFWGNLGQDVIGASAVTFDFVRMKVVVSEPQSRPRDSR